MRWEVTLFFVIVQDNGNYIRLFKLEEHNRRAECINELQLDYYYRLDELYTCNYTIGIENEHKVIGTAENPIQVHDFYFSGRRKYNKGRYLKGDNDRVMKNNTTGTRKNNYNDQGIGP